ncbi:hypothetical protein CPB84DRAFT_1853475 [Gymnopilus junonius]|uniref:Uncharacterized protein n=1 Tax=Gymnopilus junonius TaxID=109634 RepID=A0A9P5N967_GYMJU|nr:hypothetical protein CPB84DRAFT_1853475 [Gymnopilus junonius]
MSSRHPRVLGLESGLGGARRTKGETPAEEDPKVSTSDRLPLAPNAPCIARAFGACGGKMLCWQATELIILIPDATPTFMGSCCFHLHTHHPPPSSIYVAMPAASPPTSLVTHAGMPAAAFVSMPTFLVLSMSALLQF